MRISDWSSDVCSSDLSAMEREMALASSAVLRGKRLVASRDVMADSFGKTQIAARVVALNRPNRQTDRARGSYSRPEVKWGSVERDVGREGVRTCRSWWALKH